MKWFLKGLKQYTDFQGRSRRKEFFMFNLFNSLFGILLMIISAILAKLLNSEVFILLYVLYLFATILPSIALTIRRLHDIGKSGWTMLVSFIPVIGSFWLLYLLITESEPEENEYGANPKLEVL
ncbi:DUF805 domain-containing protein [Zunongwangia sp.]|uniref:DUF805 domain-containing protein n=1 Tax=Zunongwangia sp. TaxID=1965325 RepID=UPI003AA97B8C